MRDIIGHRGGGQGLAGFGKQEFGFGHLTLIGLMRGARQAQQRFQMTKRSTAELDMVAMGAHQRLIFHQWIKAEHRFIAGTHALDGLTQIKPEINGVFAAPHALVTRARTVPAARLMAMPLRFQAVTVTILVAPTCAMANYGDKRDAFADG